MNITGMLKGHDLFQSFTPKEVDLIHSISSVKKYKANEILFEYHAAVSHLFVNLKGMVHLRLPATEGEFSMVVSKIEKGEIFGISSLVGSKRYTLGAYTVMDTDVLAIEARPFRELLQSNHHVGFRFMEQIANIYFSRYVGTLQSLQGVIQQISIIR